MGTLLQTGGTSALVGTQRSRMMGVHSNRPMQNRTSHRKSGPEECMAEPPSSASPWAPLQAHNAKRDRPTSARPILPAHFAVSWSLARPLTAISTHIPASQRHDLALPDVAHCSKHDEREQDAELREFSQACGQLSNEPSTASIERCSLYDLSQQWLHSVESGVRKAEPGGPKNLTRFLVRQKTRETRDERARTLDLSESITETTSLLDTCTGRHPLPNSPGTNASKYHEFIQHMSFFRSLSSEEKVHISSCIPCYFSLRT